MATLFRLEAASGDLVTCAVAGGLESTSGQPLVLPDGTGASGLAVRERRPVVTANVLADPRVALTPEARAQITRATYRAVLAVPVLLQERVIGALAVGDLAGRVFSEEEIRLAQAFADQAAIALENARLYAEATAHRREAEAARLEAEATQERFRLLVNTLGAVVWEADPVEAGGDGASPRRCSSAGAPR
jgi:GAF domain-containing protein